MKTELFVEVDHKVKEKTGNVICGDVFVKRRIKAEDRTIIILSDGLGSGSKANILASMTASMALNFVAANSPIEHTARIILNTLPVDSYRKVSFSSFSILDIVGDQQVTLMEFGNPPATHWRGAAQVDIPRRELALGSVQVQQKLYISHFSAEMNDRIILCSDGITQSGMGAVEMPFGWGMESMKEYLSSRLLSEPAISSADFSDYLLAKALENDGMKARDDMSAAVVTFRETRKMLVCTGPPYREEHDTELCKRVEEFHGHRLICGGTTAKILAREMKKELTVKIETYTDGLPPLAEMEGVDLITEGILTIGRVSQLLESRDQLTSAIPGPAGAILNLFRQNDEIHFLVGTRVNDAHQDPTLPVELEIRRNVIKKIAALLEVKFLKRTFITYI